MEERERRKKEIDDFIQGRIFLYGFISIASLTFLILFIIGKIFL